MLLVSREYRSFVLGRIHSLTGVVPVGTFFATHLWMNARALRGAPAFDETVRALHAIPALAVVEVLFILLPLAVHAALGVGIALRGRPNAGRYPLGRNWAYTLQRVSGFVTLAFLAYHLVAIRWPLARGRLDPADLHAVLTDTLSATTPAGIPLAAAAYLVGLGAASYHFAGGIGAFCSTWGITVTPRATRWTRAAAATVGAGLFLLGASTVVHLATGGVPGFGGTP